MPISISGLNGLPGQITVSIKATDGNGHPTGADLCSGTLDGDGIGGSPGAWHKIRFSSHPTLSNGTKYAIVVRALDGDGFNQLVWREDISAATYGGGCAETSSNGGGEWTSHANSDFMFAEYGIEAGVSYLYPVAIASTEAFGPSVLNLSLKPSAIASSEALGAATIASGAVSILPSAINSLEAFGLPSMAMPFYIFPAGIVSAETLGTHTIQLESLLIFPTGIVSSEALGVASLLKFILPSAIASAETLGSATLGILAHITGSIPDFAYCQGLIYYNGYLYAVSKTSPGQVARVNPISLAVDLLTPQH